MKIIITESQLSLLIENQDVFFDLIRKIKSGGLESLKPSEVTLYNKYLKHIDKGGELDDFKDEDFYDEKYGTEITSEIPELHGLSFIYDESELIDDGFDEETGEYPEGYEQMKGSLSVFGRLGWKNGNMYTISFAILPNGDLIDYVITGLNDFERSTNKFLEELVNMNPGKSLSTMNSLFGYFLSDEVFPIVK